MKTVITIAVSILIAISTMASVTPKERITEHQWSEEYAAELEFNSRTNNWD